MTVQLDSDPRTLDPRWVAALAPALTDASLPLDRPRSKVRSTRRRRTQAEVPTGTPGRPAVPLLVAAVAVALRRYGADGRVSVGLPVAGGEGGAGARAVALDVDENERLSDLCARAEAEVAAVRALPAPDARALARALGVADVADRNPLFAVAVADAGDVDGLAELWTDAICWIEDGAVFVDHCARLFDAATADRFAGYLAWVVGVAATDPDRPVRDVDVVGDAERALLDEWGGRIASAEPPAPVTRRFRQAAAATPDAAAVEDRGEVRSYAWLDGRSARVANHLVGIGVAPGDRVGFCTKAGADQIAVLIGVLRAGAVAVPLDSTLPKSRSQSVLDQAGVGVALLDPDLAERLPAPATPVLVTPDAPVWREPERFDDRDPDPESLVYVMFTSGSTGEPKGVAMPHGALANLVDWQIRRSSAPPGWRTLNRTSTAFDVGFQEIFSTLCAGGTLVIATDEERADVFALPQIVTERRINRTFLPPVALYQMAEAAALQPHPMAELAEVVVAGEQLHVTPAVKRLFRGLKADLDNQYGPTETHVATAHRLTDSSNRWAALPPIGRPVDNAVVRIMDGRGRPAPIGGIGEIWIGGRPLAAGYVDPSQDGARFADWPAGAAGAARYYRTGDYARFDNDGALHFLGRRDDQVKVRGYRVELAEIDRALGQIPGIRERAVVARPHGDDRRIIAYVVPGEGAPGPADIRRLLEQRLPPYMVPALSCILQLDALPLTRTGKVDRQALPDPDPSAVAEEAPAAGGDLEARIAQAWARALGQESIDPDADFFDLGGHSLLGIQIVAEINAWSGVVVPLAQLQRLRTVRKLTLYVRDLMAAQEPGRKPAEAAGTPPLTLPSGRPVHYFRREEAAYFIEDVFRHHTYDKAGIVYPEGGIFVDVGANIGLFGLYVLEKAPAATIYAFEPVDALFEVLRRNLADIPDVHLFRTALAETAGEATLTFYPALSGMSSLHADRDRDRALLRQIVANLRREAGGADIGLQQIGAMIEDRFDAETIACATTTLSAVIREADIPHIDLLKIDVQRGELGVLRGLEAEHWPRVRQVVAEIHDLDGERAAAVALLEALGFRVRVEQAPIHADTPVVFVYATRP